MSGLCLVTTPIGNNSDFTKRAIEVIEQADRIFCEDTRVFKLLAKACSIDLTSKSIDSLHDHSSEGKFLKVLDYAETENCVFVSDAGSPIVSDPAYPLVKMALERGVELSSAGGVSAPVIALELSGLPPIPFHFHGFFARDNSKKNKDFETIGQAYGTHIFFEGVSRVLKTLSELTKLYPEFDFAVGRELTKEYESMYRFRGSEFSNVKESIVEKGEFTILVNNPTKAVSSSGKDAAAIAEEILKKGMKPKLVSKLVAQVLDVDAKETYSKLSRDN